MKDLRCRLAVLAIFLFTACGERPLLPRPSTTKPRSQTQGPFVGHWVSAGGSNKTLSIVREEAAFIVQDETKKMFVGRVEDGILRVSTPLGGVDFVHLKEKDHLIGGGEAYRRASESEVKDVSELITATAAVQETMQRMRVIATAWESRATDVNTYEIDGIGAGPVPTDLLERAVRPTYLRDFPRTDGWNKPFTFEVSMDGQMYTIRSAGDNGQFNEPIRGESPVSGADILFENGSFVSYPAGIKLPTNQ